jgi:hypothetical protein
MTAPAATHRVKLIFDGGIHGELLCPESGCTGSTTCGVCGRDLTDPEVKPCYDCTEMDPAECWVKTWFDNCTVDELLAGSFTVAIDAKWNGDHMTAHIVHEGIAA